MTELTLKVTDESLIPMLRKLFRSIEGVEVATKRRKKKRNRTGLRGCQGWKGVLRERWIRSYSSMFR